MADLSMGAVVLLLGLMPITSARAAPACLGCSARPHGQPFVSSGPPLYCTKLRTEVLVIFACIRRPAASHAAAGDGVLSDTVRHDLTQARVKLAVIAALSFAGQHRRFSDKGLLLTEGFALATTGGQGARAQSLRFG